ncbi:MAG: CPBP family intramembrane metalloprotease [Bacteroidales bacterium]|nr:CPBP family intramembrane metalloprotease [Bacteroidales bacterium]MDY0141250.1 CPBP family intramembrane glutamic endopeptidase [Bacteroidales bacterium]
MNISNTIKEYNYYQKTAIILFVILASMLIGQVLAGLVGMLVNLELIIESGLSEAKTTADYNTVKLLQFISAIFTFVVPALIIAKLFGDKISKYLYLNTSPKISYYIFTILFFFAILPAMNIIIVWNSSLQLPESLSGLEQSLMEMEESGKKMTEIMLKGSSVGQLLINLLLMALLPAIGEEFLFRGIIQKHLIVWTKKPHLAILLAGIIFSAVHFQFYGFIPRVILGVLFGYLVYYSGSLWPAIFAHFFNNAMAVLSFKLGGDSLDASEIDSFGTTSTDFYFVFIGLVFAYLIGKQLFKFSKNKPIK